jgi:hypothetical protein
MIASPKRLLHPSPSMELHLNPLNFLQTLCLLKHLNRNRNKNKNKNKNQLLPNICPHPENAKDADMAVEAEGAASDGRG